MTNAQMELSFANARHAAAPMSRRQRRLSRANWWFGQMRQVVDRAFDWQSAPLPRPEQIYFSDSQRN